MDKSRFFKIGIVLLVVVVSVLLIFLFFRKGTRKEAKVVLEFWSLFNNQEVYQELIKNFEKLYPNVTVNYKKFSYEEYEETLLTSLKEKKGPDIFSIHNTWLARYYDKISPAPGSLFNLKDAKKIYPQVFFKDFVAGENIFANPFYIDSLALYYNKDLFEAKGINNPPRTWDEFLKYTEILTNFDIGGNIIQSGAALGTYSNINRAYDVLLLLMIQSETKFYDENFRAIFAQSQIFDKQPYNPAERALKFYTDFANPKKRVYSFNDQLDYSLDLFAKGKLGMMLNYSWHLNTIKKKNPSLNFSISLVPQIEGVKERTFANYWGETVSAFSKNKELAWRFIEFVSRPDNLKIYLRNAQAPTPRLDLIEWQIKEMPELAVFASQIPIADSVYQYDNLAYEKIFAKMIERVNKDFVSPLTALEEAENEINRILK